MKTPQPVITASKTSSDKIITIAVPKTSLMIYLLSSGPSIIRILVVRRSPKMLVNTEDQYQHLTFRLLNCSNKFSYKISSSKSQNDLCKKFSSSYAKTSICKWKHNSGPLWSISERSWQRRILNCKKRTRKCLK